MVEGVAVVVLEDLLDHEGVAPDVDGILLIKLDLHTVLGGKE